MAPSQTTDPVEQIIIERVREDDGSLGWSWSVFGESPLLASGSAKDLSSCLNTMRQYLRDEGIAS